MKVTVKNAHLAGEVKIPASKSEAHRAMICAALSDDACELHFDGICSDIEATADCLASLGAGICRTDYGYMITPIDRVRTDAYLRCRDSGSTLRFLIPVSAALGADATFFMEGKLSQRPLSPLDAELARCGVKLTQNARELHVAGQLSEQSFSISGSVSSQFISGLMLTLPLMGGGTVTLVGKTESFDYIRLTADAMRRFGVNVEISDDKITVGGSYISPGIVRVSGDWSSASFWAVAGALSGDGITCRGVDLSSTQGDRRILEILSRMGAEVTCFDDAFWVRSCGRLNAVNIDAADIPDAVPIISVAAATANGKSRISGASRLRFKESDRIATVSELLTRMGVAVRELPDGLEIDGCDRLSGSIIDPHLDHRIAMCAAVAATSADGEVTVTNAECVGKSYGAFWDDYVSLGAHIEKYDD